MKAIKETLELALEALEKLNNTNSPWWQEVDENVIVQLSNAESALREALTSVPDWASEAIEQPAQRPQNCGTGYCSCIECLFEQQEPVAWPCVIAEADFEQNTVTLEMQCSNYKVGAEQHWLSTSPPPQRKPLTEEEMEKIAAEYWLYPRKFVRAIEAAHGIKENT